MFQGMHYVYEVYKEMSFSKAARNLFISQPSLSAAVKKTEEQIGFPIFDRSTSPIQLTELGREYIRAAETMLDVENGFRSYVDDLSGMRNGSLTIGATNLFASFVLPPLLARFIQKYPMIHIELAENGTVTLTLSNCSLDKEFSADIGAAFGEISTADGRILTGEVHALNTFDHPENVTIKPFGVKTENGRAAVVIPPCSVMAVTITLK